MTRADASELQHDGTGTFKVRPVCVVRDAFMSGIGLACVSATLLFTGPATLATLVLSVIALCLLYLMIRTVDRHGRVVAVDDRGLETTGLLGAGQTAWRDLSHVELKYFPGMIDRTKGWYELALRSAAGRMTVDSEFDGFPAIAARARRAAEKNGLALSGRSVANFISLGILPEETGAYGDG